MSSDTDSVFPETYVLDSFLDGDVSEVYPDEFEETMLSPV